MLLFPESGPKKNFRVTVSLKTATPESGSKRDFRVTFHGFTKTVTLRQRSIIPERPTAHGVLGQTL